MYYEIWDAKISQNIWIIEVFNGSHPCNLFDSACLH